MDDAVRFGAALFVAEALGGDLPADELANDLVVVDNNVSDPVFALELGSSAGVAAFLVYAFRLGHRDPDGRDGQERLAAALATMHEAERLDAPGPRAVAHADDGRHAYILATTPAMLDQLAGQRREPSVGQILHPEDAVAMRRDAAERLLQHLSSAEAAARDWLSASQGGVTERLPEEVQVALHLLEPGNLETLMSAIRELIDTPAARASQDSTGSGGER